MTAPILRVPCQWFGMNNTELGHFHTNLGPQWAGCELSELGGHLARFCRAGAGLSNAQDTLGNLIQTQILGLKSRLWKLTFQDSPALSTEYIGLYLFSSYTTAVRPLKQILTSYLPSSLPASVLSTSQLATQQPQATPASFGVFSNMPDLFPPPAFCTALPVPETAFLWFFPWLPSLITQVLAQIASPQRPVCIIKKEKGPLNLQSIAISFIALNLQLMCVLPGPFARIVAPGRHHFRCPIAILSVHILPHPTKRARADGWKNLVARTSLRSDQPFGSATKRDWAELSWWSTSA